MHKAIIFRIDVKPNNIVLPNSVTDICSIFKYSLQASQITMVNFQIFFAGVPAYDAQRAAERRRVHYAVGRPVLGQRECLVAVRRLSLHPLEDGLRLGAGADAQHVGAGDVEERLQVVTAVDLQGGLVSTRYSARWSAAGQCKRLDELAHLRQIESNELSNWP